MRKFLVVGCGGSGGATLQYLMDQLRTDLPPGIDKLPGGWQFLHVDVPEKADETDPRRPLTVAKQGGRYVGVSAPGREYATMLASVDTQLVGRDARSELVTWCPPPTDARKGGAGQMPVSDGAGQYRGIGRVLTLAGIGELHRRLEQSYRALWDPKNVAELADLAHVVSPATEDQISGTPIVLVVSSMAGGAGSSMTLDVCRLLASLPQLTSTSIGLYLYSPEVFSEIPAHLRQGIEANAAGMLGELIAAQAGEGGDGDVALLNAAGLQIQHRGAPFGRVFPIGNRIGGGQALFGDGSTDSVMRGLARGLAGLMGSGVATREFVAYGLGTPFMGAIDQSMFGWGMAKNSVVWGSFGYASVGLGRDRYGHYAAQRLARLAVDRLVDGSVQPGVADSTQQQTQQIIVNAWPAFLNALALPAPGQNPTGWLRDTVGDRAPRQTAADLVGRLLSPVLSFNGARTAGDWYANLRDVARSRHQDIVTGIDRAASEWAWAYHRELPSRLETAVADASAKYGLPVALGLLEELRTKLPQLAAELLALSGPADVTATSTAAAEKIGLFRGQITADNSIVGDVRSGHELVISQGYLHRCAQLAGQLLRSAPATLIVPMQRACNQSYASLVAARTSLDTRTGQADLRTEAYTAWPTAAQVPARFANADNEVLLTDASTFAQEFAVHVTRTRPNAAGSEALGDIVTEIAGGPALYAATATGNADTPAVAPPLHADPAWRPLVLSVNPHNDRDVIAYDVAAGYTSSLTPAGVLARATEHVHRAGSPFAEFMQQSLIDYLQQPGLDPAEQARRSRAMEQAFHEGLSLARPLVGVNDTVVNQIHSTGVDYAYEFSDLPFGDLPVGTKIFADLSNRAQLLPSTLDAYRAAAQAGARSPATRISIFGSYALFSPIAYTSMLEPIASRWARGQDRAGFWQWRRSRRLPGALPLSQAHRRALIGGYLVGRLTGQLVLPHEDAAGRLTIWDATAGSWVPFPEPLLSSPPVWAEDLIACVLESYTLAMVQAHNVPGLAPLRPYTLLRQLYDDGAQGPAPQQAAVRQAVRLPGPGGLGAETGYTSAAHRHLDSWVRTGQTVTGRPAGLGLVSDGTTSSRQESLVEALTLFRDAFRDDLLPAGTAGASGTGPFAHIASLTQLGQIPLLHEIGEDLAVVFGELLGFAGGISTAEPYPSGPGAPAAPARPGLPGM